MLSRATEKRTWPCHAVEIFNCPKYYEDSEGHNIEYKKLSGDAYAAYICAMRYQFTGEAAYANEAVMLLNGWASTNIAIGGGNDSDLVMVTAGVGLIFAAELIRGYSGWAAADRNQFRSWVSNVFRDAANRCVTYRADNRKMWGIMGTLAYAYFMDDIAAFTNTVTLLKSEIDSTIDADGHMPGETAREGNGLWYTYYALAPMTAACQIVKNVTGEDLFNWTSPNAKQVKKALDFYFFYIQHPQQWPYHQPMTIREPDFNEYPVNLFEAMGGIYQSSVYADYAMPHRNVLGGFTHGLGEYHHTAWTFPTLMLPDNYSTTTFADNFEDGNADGWTPVIGTWSVGMDANYSYRQTDVNSSGARAYAGEPAWTDYAVTTRAKVHSFHSSSPAGVGLHARYRDSNNYYTFEYYTTGKVLRIQKCVAGAYTTLASKAYTFNTGQWYTFRAALSGNNLRFYVNGVLELEVADSSFSSGMIALDAHRTNCSFNMVQVTEIPFTDNFEDGNSAGWTATSGTWNVAADGSKVYNQSSATASSATSYAGNSTWLDYTLSSKVKANTLNGSPASGVGLIARYKDSSNYYYCGYYTGGNILKIEKRVAGTYTTLASKPYTFHTGTWYTFKVTVNGNNIRFYVNNVLELETTDKTFLSGKIGLNSCRANVSFDDVLITNQ